MIENCYLSRKDCNDSEYNSLFVETPRQVDLLAQKVDRMMKYLPVFCCAVLISFAFAAASSWSTPLMIIIGIVAAVVFDQMKSRRNELAKLRQNMHQGQSQAFAAAIQWEPDYSIPFFQKYGKHCKMLPLPGNASIGMTPQEFMNWVNGTKMEREIKDAVSTFCRSVSWIPCARMTHFMGSIFTLNDSLKGSKELLALNTVRQAHGEPVNATQKAACEQDIKRELDSFQKTLGEDFTDQADSVRLKISTLAQICLHCPKDMRVYTPQISHEQSSGLAGSHDYLPMAMTPCQVFSILKDSVAIADPEASKESYEQRFIMHWKSTIRGLKHDTFY